MKHLFYIHSYITYIVSMSVVAEFNLSRSDVVFLYGRGFAYSDASTPAVVHVPRSVMILRKVPSYGSRFLMLEKYREITAFDHLISQASGNQPFIAYLPLTKNFLMQLVATHKLCVDVSFIEEGLLSYTNRVRKPTNDYFTDSLKGKFARSLRYLNHGNRSLFYRKYPHSIPAPLYMVHSPLLNEADDLDYRVLSSLVIPEIDASYVSDSDHLFIIDTVVEDEITSLNAYIRTLEQYVEEQLLNVQRRVWLRFRPHSPPAPEILSLFLTRSIDISVVPDGICIESMVYRSTGLTVVGLHSSLLFYAGIWGQTSISLLHSLFANDSQSQARYAHYLKIPADFFEFVTVI